MPNVPEFVENEFNELIRNARSFEKIVESCPIKDIRKYSAGQIKENPRNRKNVTVRALGALLFSAKANNVNLTPQCRIPRKMKLRNVGLIIEDGCGGDIQKNGFAKFEPLHDSGVDGWFVLSSIGYEKLVEEYQNIISPA